MPLKAPKTEAEHRGNIRELYASFKRKGRRNALKSAVAAAHRKKREGQHGNG